MLNNMLLPKQFFFRLCLLLFALAVPIWIMVYFVISGIQYHILFASRELEGLKLQKVITELREELSKTAQVLIQSDKENYQELRAKLAVFAEAYPNTINALSISEDMMSIQHPELMPKAIKESSSLLIQFLQDQDPKVWNSYKELDNVLYKLSLYIGDASNLILDPDLDSYYLMDVTTTKLPKVFSALLNLFVIFKDQESKILPSESIINDIQRESWVVKLEGGSDILDSLNRSLESDPNFWGPSATLVTHITPLLVSIPNETDALVSHLMKVQGNPNDNEIEQLNQSINKYHNLSYQAWYTVAHELENLLIIRRDTYQGRLQSTLGLIAFSLCMAGIACIFLVKGISRPFREKQLELENKNSELHLEIEERQRVQDSLIDAQKDLKEALSRAQSADLASQAKSEFLASMSHEIRTPLNGIHGALRLLAKSELSTQQAQFVNIAQISSESLGSLINDILDFSKIEAGKMELQNESVDIWKLVEKIIQQLVYRAKEKGITIMSLIKPNVPECIVVDPLRLSQILLNLLGNAVKFTEVGSVILQVFLVKAEDKSQRIRFEVIDTGIGITAEQQEKLFSPFEQADGSTTKKFGGTGLGLAISRKLTDLMKGKIGLSSIANKGSTFWVELPLIQGALFEDSPRYSSLATERFRVLLIDSDITRRNVTEQQLQSWGIYIYSVSGVEEAIDVIKQAEVKGEPFILGLIAASFLDATLISQLKETAKEGVFSKLPFGVMIDIGDEAKIPDCRIVELGPVLLPIKQSELFDNLLALLAKKHRLSFESSEVETSVAANVEVLSTQKVKPSQPTEQKSVEAKALIVDDNEINRIIAGELLKEIGFSYNMAENGLQAVEAIKAGTFDLILLDCHMPVMDGFEAARNIRAFEKETKITAVPIIALTADVVEGTRTKCLAAGMNECIAKPFDIEKLQKIILQFVNSTQTLPMDIKAALGRCMNNPKILQTILDRFDSQLISDSASLSKSILNKEAKQMFEVAHGLKGAAGMVGAECIREAAFKLEELGRSNETNGAEELFQKLEAEIKRYQSYMLTARESLLATVQQ